MAGLQLSGLASGFDWKGIVDQLEQVNRAPINRMQREKSALSTKTSALNEVRSLVSSLRSSVSALRSENALLGKTATFENSTTNWTAAAARATPAGEYEFNVTTLATRARLEGATGIGSTLDRNALLSDLPLGRTITNGFITVNNTRVEIASTDTLDAVLQKITTATGGTVVADYNQATDRLDLSMPGGGNITLGAGNDTSNFLQVMRLSSGGSSVSSSGNLSSIHLNRPIDQANLATPVTSGQFVVNGAAIDYDSTTDTIQDVLAKINSSNSGVTATYDLSAGRIVLTNKTTGNVGVSVVDSGGGGLPQALGLTTAGASLVAGVDAVVQVNGSTLTSRSNTFDSTIHGVTGLSVTATNTGTQTVTVKGDTTSARNALNDFISKFNALQAGIEKHTRVTNTDGKVTTGVLAGSREMADISRSLRQSVFLSAGVAGSVQRLSDLGITTSGIENTISITGSSLLDDKLTNATDDVRSFLTTAGTGFISRLESMLGTSATDVGAASGKIGIQLTSIEKQNKSLDRQIEDVERRLAMQRQMMESSFIAMERAQSQFQQQSSYLQRTFSGGSK
jgi:flagellar hook-associated protein 2